MIGDVTALSLATIGLLGSPGPVPLALAGVGASFGPRRGIPFLLGILSGIFVVMLLTTFGVATLLDASPVLKRTAQIAAFIYIVYIAWRVATGSTVDASMREAPPSFRDGFLLNILNPKAYAALFAISSAFGLTMTNNFLSIGLTFFVTYFWIVVVDAAWLMTGGAVRPIAVHPSRGRWLRFALAGLMVAAAGLAVASV